MTKHNPTVSIIVPVYKAENYIGTCIESIQTQTYSDWELILIDDGSPDKSGKVCERYAAEDERIIVVHQKNGGVSKARNTGLQIAKGKYVSFVDADDYVLPTYLSDMLEYEADVVVTGYINRYEPTGRIQKEVIDGDRYYSLEKGNVGKGLIDLEMDYRWLGPAAKLFSRDIIVDQNIKFDESLDYGEDHLFNMEFGKYVKSISYLNRYNYVYMHRNIESLTNRIVPSETMFNYILQLYRMRINYCKTRCENNKQYILFTNKSLTFYYWQTLYSMLRDKNKSNLYIIEAINNFSKLIPDNIIYSSLYRLPLTYTIIRCIYKLLPIKVATFILKIY